MCISVTSTISSIINSWYYIVLCTCYTGGFHDMQSVLFFLYKCPLIIRGSLNGILAQSKLCIVVMNALWVRSQKFSLKEIWLAYVQ